VQMLPTETERRGQTRFGEYMGQTTNQWKRQRPKIKRRNQGGKRIKIWGMPNRVGSKKRSAVQRDQGRKKGKNVEKKTLHKKNGALCQPEGKGGGSKRSRSRPSRQPKTRCKKRPTTKSGQAGHQRKKGKNERRGD